ncbi:glycine zipper 2TM domain-containing protein [Novosphingobium sp. JCM 18896]|uniref:glycine zipper 2TM domain-containing protein n=1 Tax=Novosphingobium sp. JCM 18896 TaxID=2989731 RepID=UPI0022238DB5|nr:glycine zipper 2TM domain-containing protein [Novosphingobium sp. JCM 18896]MCW1430446.1 glycine zipper 2TM domain-containing protein [Novosphingobium sp. JCM 18896]
MIKLHHTALIGLASAGMIAAAAPATAATAFDVPAQVSTMTGTADLEANQYRDRNWRDGRGYRNYNNNGYYNGPSWRGRDGRYYCRRNDGTTGLLIGGAVGGLIGNSVAGRGGDRTLGTILGVAGGALLGREVDRGGSSRRCR